MKHVSRFNSYRETGVSSGSLPDLAFPSIPHEKREPKENGKDEGVETAFLTRDPDQNLIGQCRAGNRRAFSLLVLRHKDRLYAFAYHVLGDRGEAEDMVQETFLRAYEKLEEFRGEAKFSTWLYCICRNLCLSRLEHTKKYAPDGLMPEVVPAPSLDVSEQVIGKERQRLVNWAIPCLKPEFREVVLLYHIHHFSYDEIATLLGQPIGTVRSRLHRGREELKELLRPYLKEV